MIQAYSVAVPCKLYIKKYFTTLYGDPMELDHKTDFGDTILTKLAQKPLYRLSHHQLNQAFLFYDSELNIQLPMDFFYRIAPSPTKQQTYNINRYLENHFKSDLFQIISCGAFFGAEIRTIIETFSLKYKIVIDEDITYEALQKSYYRYRKSSTAKNIFLVNLSSPFKSNLRA